MRLLAFGDLHLKPSGTGIDYDQLTLPPETDAVVTVGDVVHRTDPESLAVGQAFFDHLESLGTPVISVPGNHDPERYHERLIGDRRGVVNAHGRVVSAEAFEGSEFDGRLGGHGFVGWGCETFDQTLELRATDVPSLGLRRDDRGVGRHAADRAATRLEDAVLGYVRNDVECTELLASLDIGQEYRAECLEKLDRTRTVYETLSDLLHRAPSPSIVLTHVPPYNTGVDRHHSVGTGETAPDMLHCGSLGLKLALRVHEPLVALNGHSHGGEYEPGDGPGGRPHVFNLGYQGVATVTVDGTAGGFGFERFSG